MESITLKTALKKFNEIGQPFQFILLGNRKLSTSVKNTYGIDSYKTGNGAYVFQLNNKVLAVSGIGYRQQVTVMSLAQFQELKKVQETVA